MAQRCVENQAWFQMLRGSRQVRSAGGTDGCLPTSTMKTGAPAVVPSIATGCQTLSPHPSRENAQRTIHSICLA